MNSFHRINYNVKERKANEQTHHAIATVKRTAGCTENQGSWPQANWQYVYNLVSKVEISNVATITGARCYSSDSPQGRLEVPCTLGFSQ